ncbi:unnamed protein product [Durusdinium trenchii]|uniref:Uncharacterized protein n=1 Tax=Durusdinium trenchii TaxID=1381693 RepID=A0ABP0NNX7_9DINO
MSVARPKFKAQSPKKAHSKGKHVQPTAAKSKAKPVAKPKARQVKENKKKACQVKETKKKGLKNDYNNIYSRTYHWYKRSGATKEQAGRSLFETMFFWGGGP